VRDKVHPDGRPTGTGDPISVSRRHLSLLLVAILFLVLGSLVGLARIGWDLPFPAAFVGAHGPLMVSGFLGTLIVLERAVALGSRWGFVGPSATAAGAVALLLEPLRFLGPLLILYGTVLGVLLFADVARRHPSPATGLIFLGSLSWLAGNLLWAATWPDLLSGPAVVFWIGFPVLVIVGERLELSRVLRPSSASMGALVVLAGAFLVGAALPSLGRMGGSHLAGAALVGMALWLLTQDIARVQLRAGGLARYVAVALLPGYVWLAAGGVLLFLPHPFVVPYAYDAMLHAIFLGFVMSMIFAHAPIVFPSLLGGPLAFRPFLYGPLALLQASVVSRVLGDVVGGADLRAAAGLLNVLAVLGFLGSTVAARRAGARESTSAAG